MSDPIETLLRMEKMYVRAMELLDSVDADFVNLRLEIVALQRELAAAEFELEELKSLDPALDE